MMNIRNFWMVSVLALMSLCIASCGGDDDNGGGGFEQSNYGQAPGKSGTIVRGWTSGGYSPFQVETFSFDYGSGLYEKYEASDYGRYYSPVLDSAYPPYEGSHIFFESTLSKYFTYSYNPQRDVYKIDYNDDTTEYYRINFSNGDVKKLADASGEYVSDDYSSDMVRMYDYALPFYYYSSSSGGSSSGGSSSGTLCTVCNGSGVCQNCDGTGQPGYYDKIVGNTQCGFCHGSGLCANCGGTGYKSSSSSGSGSGSSSDNDNVYDYSPTTAIKIIKTGTGSKATYAKYTESMYKGIRKSDNKVFLFKQSKTLVGSASRNTDTYCGDYKVSDKDYKTTDPGIGYTNYYYFD